MEKDGTIGRIDALWDDVRFPALLIASCCITAVVALILLWTAIFFIDLFGPSLAWLSSALGGLTILVGIVVFTGDFIRRLWMVRNQILLEV
jgi:hypothetical protein